MAGRHHDDHDNESANAVGAHFVLFGHGCCGRHNNDDDNEILHRAIEEATQRLGARDHNDNSSCSGRCRPSPGSRASGGTGMTMAQGINEATATAEGPSHEGRVLPNETATFIINIIHHHRQAALQAGASCKETTGRDASSGNSVAGGGGGSSRSSGSGSSIPLGPGDTWAAWPGDWCGADTRALPVASRCKRVLSTGARPPQLPKLNQLELGNSPELDNPQTVEALDCLQHELVASSSSCRQQRQSRTKTTSAIELFATTNKTAGQDRLMGATRMNTTGGQQQTQSLRRQVVSKATDCRACCPTSKFTIQDERDHHVLVEMTTAAGCERRPPARRRLVGQSCATRTGQHLLARLANCLKYVRAKLISLLLLAIILLD